MRGTEPPAWTDASTPVAERAELLLGEMTLEEKLAQLGSVWVGAEPLQEAFAEPAPFEEASADGIGHITRPLGTRPVDPVEGARRLADLQRDLAAPWSA